VKPAAFEYHRADSVDDAIRVLGQAGERGRPIAGGQSLGPMLNLRLARPEVLVDIRNCPSLRGFVDEGDSIVYGAGVTHAEFEDGQVPDATGGWLQHAARRIAYRAIRNRGTMGGSLAHADPAADWGTVLHSLWSCATLARERTEP
jgi:carbon-monoxide dehydrogenase medium subunit